LAILAVSLAYYGYWGPSDFKDPNLPFDPAALPASFGHGLAAAFAVFLGFGALSFPDGLLQRPHPLVWRIMTAVFVAYAMLLAFLLLQPVGVGRALVAALDPALGKPMVMKDYADACDIYTPDDPVSRFRNVYDVLNDEFVLAHFLGWIAHALLLRDESLLWVYSIVFELLELTFQHLLANFKECWWDHIIIDVLMANAAGIYVGLWMVKSLKMRQYRWIGTGPLSAQPRTPSARLRRVGQQLLPATFDDREWGVFGSWRQLLGALCVLACLSVMELNAFWLKYALWIPPPHWINVTRLFLMTALGLAGYAEWYDFVIVREARSDAMLGSVAWISLFIGVLETTLCAKWLRGAFKESFPTEVVWCWGVGSFLFLAFFTIYFKVKATRNEAVAHGGPEALREKKYKSA
jgi:phosphatidylserine synthase 2